MFVVIEFEDGDLSIVHKKWLTPKKKEVFWPPYKDQAIFYRALKKVEDINTELWELFKVKKCFYETGMWNYIT